KIAEQRNGRLRDGCLCCLDRRLELKQGLVSRSALKPPLAFVYLMGQAWVHSSCHHFSQAVAVNHDENRLFAPDPGGDGNHHDFAPAVDRWKEGLHEFPFVQACRVHERTLLCLEMIHSEGCGEKGQQEIDHSATTRRRQSSNASQGSANGAAYTTSKRSGAAASSAANSSAA